MLDASDKAVIDPPGGSYSYDHHGNFYNFIVNPDIPVHDNTANGSPTPYNRDTFILISSGNDQRYGTDDDITNFVR